MAVIRYLRYTLSSGESSTNRPPGAYIYFSCDTEAELPAGTSAQDGDAAYTNDSGKRWNRTAGAWVLRTTDSLANQVQDAAEIVYTVAALTDGQFLKRSGANITSQAMTKSDVGLGSVDNTSDAAKPVSTAVQTALDAKQVAGSYATGSGTANGTNTGDQVNISGNAGTVTTNANLTGHVTSTGNAAVLGSFTLAQLNSAVSDANVQDALVSGTNIKTVNGSSLLGSGNLAVSASDPSYSPGSFTVATETARIQPRHLKMTTTQRVTLAGTATLRLS